MGEFASPPHLPVLLPTRKVLLVLVFDAKPVSVGVKMAVMVRGLLVSGR